MPNIAFLVFFLLFCGLVLKRWLQFFQQHEYNPKRFLFWACRRYSFLPRWSFFKKDCFNKKPLVFTSRAKRIFVAALVLVLIKTSAVYFFFQGSFSFFGSLGLIIVFLPVILVAGNLLLWPHEKLTQLYYKKDAKQILKKFQPKVLAITGSYGKTSTKLFLGQILNNFKPTLTTPGSTNTLMGTTKIIREQLKKEHNFLLVEMGAYKKGSIAKLCKFTPPYLGILTYIGLAHYERFKSIENVKEAKAELIKALPKSGIAIFNGGNKYCRQVAKSSSLKKKYFYGLKEGNLDCWAENIKQTKQGLEFDILWQSRRYSVEPNIFGRHNVQNILAAWTAACAIGAPPLTVQSSVNNLKSASHRLEVSKTKEGIIIIDDTYNSNPAGFAGALEVLKKMSGKRKVLVTPGMVELGAKSKEEHQKIARQAAQVCDQVFLVGERARQFLREALAKEETGVKVSLYYSLQKVQRYFKDFLRAGDVVLYENDLPDIYK